MRSLYWYGYHDNPEGAICPSSIDVYVPIQNKAVRDDLRLWNWSTSKEPGDKERNMIVNWWFALHPEKAAQDESGPATKWAALARRPLQSLTLQGCFRDEGATHRSSHKTAISSGFIAMRFFATCFFVVVATAEVPRPWPRS